jgi:hypothetical protein
LPEQPLLFGQSGTEHDTPDQRLVQLQVLGPMHAPFPLQFTTLAHVGELQSTPAQPSLHAH